jgi:predicted lipoprotein
MRTRWFVTTAVVLLVASTDTATADESTRCVELVKECFARDGSARDTCFKAASSDAFCKNSETGKLAAKRADMSALVPDDADVGPSLLGPDLVDRECIKNFDNSWMASVVQAPPSAETSVQLNQSLQACAKKSASDVMRP